LRCPAATCSHSHRLQRGLPRYPGSSGATPTLSVWPICVGKARHGPPPATPGRLPIPNLRQKALSHGRKTLMSGRPGRLISRSRVARPADQKAMDTDGRPRKRAGRSRSGHAYSPVGPLRHAGQIPSYLAWKSLSFDFRDEFPSTATVERTGPDVSSSARRAVMISLRFGDELRAMTVQRRIGRT